MRNSGAESNLPFLTRLDQDILGFMAELSSEYIIGFCAEVPEVSRMGCVVLDQQNGSCGRR